MRKKTIWQSSTIKALLWAAICGPSLILMQVAYEAVAVGRFRLVSDWERYLLVSMFLIVALAVVMRVLIYVDRKYPELGQSIDAARQKRRSREPPDITPEERVRRLQD